MSLLGSASLLGVGGAVGARLESYTFDLSAYDTGSILGGGAVPIQDVTGAKTINLYSYRDAFADDIALSLGSGLVITPKVNANYDNDTPGVSEIDLRDVWSDLDLTTDLVGFAAQMSASPISANYQGYGLAAYESATGFASRRVDVGCLYDGAIQRYVQQLGPGSNTQYVSSGAQQNYPSIVLFGLNANLNLDTSMPASPFAATLLRQTVLFDSVPAGTANPYTAATLRFAMVAIRGPGAQPTITVPQFKVWRLRLDASV